MRQRAWQIAGLLGLVAVTAFVTFDDPMIVESIWTATAVGCAVAIPIGVRLHRVTTVGPWRTLGVAMALLAVSNLLIHPLWVHPSVVDLADAITIPALVLVAVGVFQMAQAQVPGGDREGAIDAAIVMIATATALAATVHHPGRLSGTTTSLELLLHAYVGPLLMAAIVAGGMRLLFAGTARLPAGWFLGGAAWGAMAGNIVRAEQVVQGTYQRGTFSELLVLAPYVLIGMAALHPSAATLVEESPWRHRRLTHARLLVLGVALLVPPVTMVVTTRDVQTLTGVATVLVGLLVLWRVSRLAVENESSRRELRRQAERQEALARLGRQALDTQEPDDLVAEAVGTCIELLDLERCEVTRVGDDSGPTRARPGAVGRTQTFELGGDGVALIATHHNDADPEDVAFLESVATLITVALERHASVTRLRWAATHDPLTTLPNRAMVHDRLDELLRRADPVDTVHVVFVDLDDFKHVNDTHGHRTGDRVLVAVARRLLAGTRDGDVAGRLSGDEFVVLCPDSSPDAVDQFARRLADHLSQPYEVDGHRVVIGASVGVARASDSTRDAEALLAAADAAMYEAKPGGVRAALPGRSAGPPTRWPTRAHRQAPH